MQPNDLTLTSAHNPTGDREWRRRYEAHLKSAKWKNIRRDLMKLRGAICELCRRPSARLEIDHLTYERLGNELLSDLQILCPLCHKEEHVRRQEKDQSKRILRRENAAFVTWYEKKTGWDADYATDEDWQEFQRWLDCKNEEFDD